MPQYTMICLYRWSLSAFRRVPTNSLQSHNDTRPVSTRFYTHEFSPFTSRFRTLNESISADQQAETITCSPSKANQSHTYLYTTGRGRHVAHTRVHAVAKRICYMQAQKEAETVAATLWKAIIIPTKRTNETPATCVWKSLKNIA